MMDKILYPNCRHSMLKTYDHINHLSGLSVIFLPSLNAERGGVEDKSRKFQKKVDFLLTSIDFDTFGQVDQTSPRERTTGSVREDAQVIETQEGKGGRF